MKKILSMILAFALCLSLVGCGSAAAANDSGTSGSSNSAAVIAETAAAPSEEELLAAETAAEEDVETTVTITLSDGVSDNEYAAALGARRAVRERDRAGRLHICFRLRLGGEKRGFGLRFGPARIGSAVVCRRGAAAADKRNAQRETKQRG